MAIVAAVLSLGVAAQPLAQARGDGKLRPDSAREAAESSKKAEKELSAGITALRVEGDQLKLKLIETARQIQQREVKLGEIEAREQELGAQEKMLKGSFAQQHDSNAKLLGAMLRMGRNPPPVMITQREDALKMVRSAKLLAAALNGLNGNAAQIAGQLDDLARVLRELKADGEKLRAENAQLNEERTRLALLQETNRQAQSEKLAGLEKFRREMAELAKTANLGDLIETQDRVVAGHVGRDLGPKPGPAVTPAEPVAEPVPAAPPRETETALASPPPPPAPPAPVNPPDAQAVAGVAPKPAPGPAPGTAVELAPKGTQTAALNPGRLKPAMPFIETKGALQLPAQGRRVLAFGDKTQYGGQSKGIVLETRHSAQIIAPADAWVVFAGEFRSFGQLLIMNAGDGYHILLAGLSHIDVQLGEFVLAGQPVGVMNGPTKGAKAKAAENAPVLYVEFRKNGQPTDPEPWWAPEARQKLQG